MGRAILERSLAVEEVEVEALREFDDDVDVAVAPDVRRVPVAALGVDGVLGRPGDVRRFDRGPNHALRPLLLQLLGVTRRLDPERQQLVALQLVYGLHAIGHLGQTQALLGRHDGPAEIPTVGNPDRATGHCEVSPQRAQSGTSANGPH